MHINTDPYWFTSEGIAAIEEQYNAKYMGYWCTKRPNGEWNESPVDVFYVENPDRSKGHSNYFGMFSRDSKTFITNAESAFSEPILGVLTSSDEVLVSRYRHHYISRDGQVVDGGRDYCKRSYPSTLVSVTIDGGKFRFELQKEIDNT